MTDGRDPLEPTDIWTATGRRVGGSGRGGPDPGAGPAWPRAARGGHPGQVPGPALDVLVVAFPPVPVALAALVAAPLVVTVAVAGTALATTAAVASWLTAGWAATATRALGAWGAAEEHSS